VRNLSEAIARQLLDYGLSEKEANIYLTLLRSGKARAGEIARKLQINRMIVYRVLTKLQERELVKATVEKPMKFIPVSLEKALDLLIKETESKLGLMRDRYETVTQSWDSIDREPPATDVLSFKIVQGRKHIYDLLLNMFSSANTHIRLVTTKRDLVRFQYVDLDDALKNASKRGVKVQIVIQYEDDKFDIISHYVGFASVKVVPISKATRLFIADDKEMIITFTTDDSMALNTKQETCLKIQSTEGKSLDTLLDIFANFWESADELDMLNNMSSKPLEDVKTLRTEEAFNRTLENMVQNAQSQLIIGIPKDAPPLSKEKIVTEVSKRLGQLYIRALLHVDQEDLENVKLLEGVEACHTELLQSMQFVVKDQSEILITLYLNEADKTTRCKHIWSNSRLYVESMTGLLTDFWQKSVSVANRVDELERLRTATGCLSELKSAIERNNWRVESFNPSASGNGSPTQFALLAENAKGTKLAAEFIRAGDERNLEFITSFYGKAVNAGVNALFLVATSTVTPQELSLAQYFNMHTLTAQSKEELGSTLKGIDKQLEEFAEVRLIEA
jgi:HTH-type transcriptional regulator, sugar sensing transcriptional regulator